MLFFKILRYALLVGVLFNGVHLCANDMDDTEIILEKSTPKKATGLLHRLPKDTTQLYFNQGPLVGINQAVIKSLPFVPYVQQLKIYSHFSTRALADVVRYDAQLAKGLADLKMQTRGFSDAVRDSFVMRELEDLAQSHIFYVLGDFRDSQHPHLDDPYAAWHVFLQFEDGSRLVPNKVEEIDFDAETRKVFGSDWYKISALKTPYRLTFSRSEGQEHMGCRLIFSAPDIEEALAWPPLEAADIE
jgi:hypothetical protein